MQTHHHVDLPCQAVAGSGRTNNRRAKFHALTRAGQKHLNKEAANCDARRSTRRPEARLTPLDIIVGVMPEGFVFAYDM